jgi:hypothetical protein
MHWGSPVINSHEANTIGIQGVWHRKCKHYILLVLYIERAKRLVNNSSQLMDIVYLNVTGAPYGGGR